MPTVLKLNVSRATPLFRGQDHYWRLMLAMTKAADSFTVTQVRACTDDPTTAPIRAFVARLVKAGIAEETGETAESALGGRDERVYRLIKRPDDLPVISRDGSRSRPTTAQQQMWNVMRGPLAKAGFTTRDLVAYGSTDDLPIMIASATQYVRHLGAAGYLVLMEQGAAHRPSVWRLKPSKNSGPKAPRILRAKIVWDENRAAIAGDVIAEEEPA